jgi:AcrR family transcriptional regulator
MGEPPNEPVRGYHHGDLRRAVLAGALEEVAAKGASSVSLRSIARRAGVSHSAPQHHFGDKRGVLSAVAAEGFDLLAAATGAAWDRRRQMLDVGLAYIRFAIGNRAHFEVMFRPELFDPDDPAVTAARDRAAAVIFETVTVSLGEDAADRLWGGVIGVWAFVHGFSTLWLSGTFYPEVGEDPEAAARDAVAAVRLLATTGALGPGGEEARPGARAPRA